MDGPVSVWMLSETATTWNVYTALYCYSEVYGWLLFARNWRLAIILPDNQMYQKRSATKWISYITTQRRKANWIGHILHRICLISYLLTYLLTPWSRVLLDKLTGSSIVQKFPAFYGTRKFITAFTSARHLSLSWASSIQSIPTHPTSWSSILILSSHLRLGLPSGLFPSGFPTKTLYTPLLSPIRATCTAHLTFLDFITQTILGEQYRSFSSSLCSFLHYPVTPSLLGPNILLSNLFWNTETVL